MKLLKYNKTYNLNANNFKKSGYSFVGWNTRADGKGDTYKNKASIKNLTYKNNGNITLYAMWKKKTSNIIIQSITNTNTQTIVTYKPNNNSQTNKKSKTVHIPTVDYNTSRKYVKWNKLSEKNVYKTLMLLKKKYKEGTKWTNDYYYEWSGGYYKGAHGCASFAFMLSDIAFYDTLSTMHCNFNKVKVGDTIRLDFNTHTVIVLEVKKNSIIVAEANPTIHWGREISFQELYRTGTYVLTRYPLK